MSDLQVLVYASLKGVDHLVGNLHCHLNKGKESASFVYAQEWLANPLCFSLQPDLRPGPGAFHSQHALFGSLGDSAPDRWGRTLMRRAEARRAKNAKEKARTLYERDYLLMVNDETRQGALRFCLAPGEPFLSNTGTPVPPVIDLPRLLSATDALLADADTAADLRLLLAPGSSLGGARPKASVREKDGALAIAKFPKADDGYPTVVWEYVALQLAQSAGLTVPHVRLESIAKRSVLILKRFDRAEGERIPFLSAMSMLNAKDNEVRSYLELMDALRQHGAAPKQDGVELWRRIVFSILISNTDDHLRNHGYLLEGQKGWRLSPAYDLNPVPVEIKERILSTAVTEEDATASLELALSVADHFGLKASQAKTVAAEVGKAVKGWRKVAEGAGLKKGQIEAMSSAFEHEDLTLALKF